MAGRCRCRRRSSVVTCTHNGDWGLCEDCANGKPPKAEPNPLIKSQKRCICGNQWWKSEEPSPTRFPLTEMILKRVCRACAGKGTTDVHQLLARGRVGNRVEAGPAHGSGTAARPVRVPDEEREHGQPGRGARATMIHRLLHSILRRKRIRRCPVCRHLSANIVRPMSHEPRSTGQALRQRLLGEA